jgi:hypothetical protein
MEGSAMDVLEDSAATAELDAQTIKTMGERQAWAFRSDATHSRFQGEAAMRGAQLGAAGTLLGAGAKAFGSASSAAMGGA